MRGANRCTRHLPQTQVHCHLLTKPLVHLAPAGGASYWGRRAFERHFREWRHENGMRALGIPNSKKVRGHLGRPLGAPGSVAVRAAPCPLLHPPS